MEDLSLFIVGLLIPAIALLAKLLVEFYFKNRTKVIIAKRNNEEVERIYVNANLSELDIIKTFEISMARENAISERLIELSRNISQLETRRSKIVDFVATCNSHKIAIEVKNSINTLTNKQIDRYFSAEDGIEKLLIISNTPPSAKFLEKLNELDDPGRVSILNYEAIDSEPKLLENSIRENLKIANA